ncbi:hypothetical protein TRIP_E210010 [uncultured Spirochaetota bacterium]|uniref:Uncharacterized protein n=1 Tax=uncultured Spirochaetota bacterium TaxID=460511 RepID=A0A652ZV36_9SPIR|nr:hypothetical protein TRIP_E210010 [uncultured Spirochaetota bacterium]
MDFISHHMGTKIILKSLSDGYFFLYLVFLYMPEPLLMIDRRRL